MINRKISEALDMELPPEEVKETLPVTVEAHELSPIENSQLPDMTDVDRRMIEGEKQLEDIIHKGLSMMDQHYEAVGEVEPRYRNRHMEIAATLMSSLVDAIKHKTDLQIKKKEQRMKEADFTTGNKSSPKTINATFIGSREDLRRILDEKTPEDDTSE